MSGSRIVACENWTHFPDYKGDRNPCLSYLQTGLPPSPQGRGSRIVSACWRGRCSKSRSEGRLSAPSRKEARPRRSPLVSASGPSTASGPASERCLQMKVMYKYYPSSLHSQNLLWTDKKSRKRRQKHDTQFRMFELFTARLRLNEFCQNYLKSLLIHGRFNWEVTHSWWELSPQFESLSRLRLERN